MDTQTAAVDIIHKHWDNAWKIEYMARHHDSTGRYTKEKRRQREIAEAVAAELKAIVQELSEAGYKIDGLTL